MLITSDASAIASLMRSKPGSLAAYPTETFYGLGVLINSRDGLDRIITVKGRDVTKGMIVLVSDLTMASCIAVIDNDQKMLLERLWPGPVSVVLEAKQDIDPLIAPDGKVALRISPNILATSLVEMVGPITSTSANRSGVLSSTPSWMVARHREANPPPSSTLRPGRLCALGKGQ